MARKRQRFLLSNQKESLHFCTKFRNSLFSASLEDLSEEGFRLSSGSIHRLSLGDLLTMEFQLRGREIPAQCELIGVVLWIRADLGVCGGVFLCPNEERMNFLKHLLGRVGGPQKVPFDTFLKKVLSQTAVGHAVETSGLLSLNDLKSAGESDSRCETQPHKKVF